MDNNHKITVQQSVSNTFDIHFHDDIEGPWNYSEELAAIASAGPSDIINVSLCTDGGSVQSALLITKALSKTPALTRAIIGPNCCSSGTVIALACDEWELDEHSMFMIHTASFGLFGKSSELKGQFEFKMRWVENVVRTAYTGFLSEQEIVEVLDGKDFWFGADELNERLGYYAEYRKAQYELDMANTPE